MESIVPLKDINYIIVGDNLGIMPLILNNPS